MILRLRQITFSYSPGKKLLDECSCELRTGSINALLGSNGAGKTTLFNLVTGFLKPQAGSINFNDRDITNLKPYQINRLGIGRTFQDLRTITRLTVKENILLAMRHNPTDQWYKGLLPFLFHKSTLAQLEHVAGEISSRFFLDDVKHHPAGAVSYGQQKLLTVACCVANGAEMLLLDEPVAGINPDGRSKMVGLLKELKRQGRTILLIEHDTDFVEEVSDSIYVLAAGKLREYATLREMRADPKFSEAYL